MTVIPPLPDRNQMSEESRRLIQKLLYGSGVVFFLISSFILMKPEIVQDFLGLDKEIAMMLGGALMFTAVADFLIARFIYKENDKK